MNYIVSAYNAAPLSQPGNTVQEEQYWRGLGDLEHIQGVELPFDMSLHPISEDWLLKQISREWDIVITLIPGTVRRMKEDAQFGLASTCSQSRAAALKFCREARLAIERVNAALGRNAVIAVQIHSAPSVQHPADPHSKAALVSALCELASWDWMEARLVIEHCDANNGVHQPAKGFLAQQIEIEAALTVNHLAGTNIGVSVNWARSVIEARRSSAALAHIEHANGAGLLAGITFSGCSPQETAYGPAWADAHLPPAAPAGLSDAFAQAARGSILTQRDIIAALSSCDRKRLDFIGVKVAAPKSLNPTPRERIAIVRDSTQVINTAVKSIPWARSTNSAPDLPWTREPGLGVPE